MYGVFSRDMFEYVWRNISMDSSLLDRGFDNTVGEGGDGQFKRGQEWVEEVIEAETVEDKDVLEEPEDNNNNDDDDGVDYKTITEGNDNKEEEQEKWYYTAQRLC